jgi:peptidoglycan/LPS O-acetylase OafA/YrhL
VPSTSSDRGAPERWIDSPTGHANYTVSLPFDSMTATLTIQQPVQATSRTRSFYRPELDVLRFFAFLAVFLFHFSHPVDFYVQHGVPRLFATVVNGILLGGVFGVDLFFVLSAYLITELLLREKEEFGSLDVKSFYLRRILRIWPLYFFYIGLALIPAFNPNHVFTWRHAAAYLLLAGNWSVVVWGWPLHSIIGPLWTVSIEEQFYLLWPPIVRTISRNRLAYAAIAMLLISNVTRVVMIAIHGGQNSVWCNTLARLDPIVAGILVAAVLRGTIPRFSFPARLGMLASGIMPLALVATYWKIHEPEQLEWIPTLVGFPVVALSCTLILLSVLGISTRLPRTLVYLGKISYGLYVYHALGNVLSNRLIPVHNEFIQLALRPIAALAITLILASVSYAVLEKPFLKIKDRFARIHSRPV